jgi:hypothetical protein
VEQVAGPGSLTPDITDTVIADRGIADTDSPRLLCAARTSASWSSPTAHPAPLLNSTRPSRPATDTVIADIVITDTVITAVGITAMGITDIVITGIVPSLLSQLDEALAAPFPLFNRSCSLFNRLAVFTVK